MLTLALLRHAKSSWDDAALGDHERPLSKRGSKAAPRVGRYLATEGFAPDVVLSSDSVRTRATVALLLPELSSAPREVVYAPELYLASPADLLGRIRTVGDAAKTLLVVGHNPGLHMLALSLVGRGAPSAIAALAQGYPTAALAILRFKGKEWADIAPGRGELMAFVVPRELD
jgi:phosphohistidine phosphatase